MHLASIRLDAPPPAASFADAFSRAEAMAGAVPGAYADAPCRFVALPADAPGERWVLVVCQRTHEAGHQAHLRERSYTAAQRFLLSLACDGVDAEWHPDVPDAETLRAAGVTLGAGVAVGRIRCGAG